MWDLVGNPEDRFSHNEAQIVFLIGLQDLVVPFQPFISNFEQFLKLACELITEMVAGRDYQ